MTNTVALYIPVPTLFLAATLYTNIPHDSLKCNLKVLINEAFRVRGAGFLTVDRQGVAYWSVELTSGFCFSFDKLLEMLEYLIDNIYIVMGNKVFQQRVYKLIARYRYIQYKLLVLAWTMGLPSIYDRETIVYPYLSLFFPFGQESLPIFLA